MEWSSFLTTYSMGVVMGILAWELLYRILKKNGLIK